jgi:hypothetical protein
MTGTATALPGDPLINTLQDILAELRKKHVPDDLWTADMIATYLHLGVGTVRNRVLSHPTFPRAVRIPTTDDGGGRRWPGKEVIAWALKHREAK